MPDQVRHDEMLRIPGQARYDVVQHDGEIAGRARNDGCMYFGVLAFGVVRVWEKPPPVLP